MEKKEHVIGFRVPRQLYLQLKDTAEAMQLPAGLLIRLFTISFLNHLNKSGEGKP